uniref:Uncharacterized protein n=1 Tax=Arundo donax TaxID=35708 RepID=A0A0A9C4S1_ARUDO
MNICIEGTKRKRTNENGI